MIKFIKKLAVIGTLFIIGASAFASGLDNQNAIGLYVIGAETSIGGLQYERRFTDVLSVKFGGFASYQNRDTYNSGEAQFNFVVEPDFTLYEADWGSKVGSRLFAFGLVGYDYQRICLSRWDTTDPNKRLADEVKNQYSLVGAAGFGFDFIFFGHLSVPIQFGFLGMLNTIDPNVGFCAGVGLRYSW